MKRIIAIGAGAFLAGCSLIYASDLDDAREPTSTVVPDSGGVETSTPVIGDSGTRDVVESGAVADASGCALFPDANFCDDFDDPTLPLGTGWDLLQTQSTQQHTSGSLAFDTTQFVSAPRAGKVTLDGTDDCGYVRFEKRFAVGAATRFHTRFSFMPSSPWKNQNTPFAIALTNDGQTGYCAALMFADSDASGKIIGTAVDVQSTTASDDVHDVLGSTPTDVWSVIDLVVTRDANGGSHLHYTITPPGGPAATSDISSTACPTWTHAQILVGFHCDSGQGVSYYDDIEADWQ